MLSRGEHVVSIPGTTNLGRLDQNAAAAGIRLSADELASLDRILPANAAIGTRYPEQRMSSVNG